MTYLPLEMFVAITILTFIITLLVKDDRNGNYSIFMKIVCSVVLGAIYGIITAIIELFLCI